ncbi:MAG: hypothetical protein ABSH33_11350, partial [Steroidobacteraceae bacterium]
TQVWIGEAHNSTVYVVSDSLVKVTVPTDATTAHLGFINPQRSDFTDSNFTVTKGTSTTPPGSNGTVSGTVAGPASASVVLSGKSTRVASLGAAGSYNFAAVAAGTYTVSPTTAGHVFTPTSVVAQVADAPVKNLNFMGAATTAPTYTISGTISGSGASDATVTLNGSNVGAAATDLGGTYSFSGVSAGTYTVSASLPGQTFSQSRTVTVNNVDLIENNFTSAATPGGANIQVAVLDPLPKATVGQAYSTSVLKSVSGGKGAYRYQTGEFASGTPPVGMILTSTGTLTGTPKAAGNYTFQVCAADAAGDVSDTCATTALTVAPQSTQPPPPPPPPPPAGTSWVYYNGVFDWPGDYSYVASPNYADTSGDPLSGPYDIKVTLEGAYGGWLPYAKNWDFNSTGYTKLTFALKPTVNNQVWWVYFVKVGDVPVGIYLDVSKYGPAPVAGQWATYTVPLADLGVLGTDIYKFCIQDQTGLSNNSWYADNVGFAP